MSDQRQTSHYAEIDALLSEDRHFDPPPAFAAAAVVRDSAVYDEAARDPEGFWARFARELEWQRPFTKVLDWEPPHARWFADGQLNACVNCVDRHTRGPRRNKAAIIWEGEPGEHRTLTYFDLYRQVSTFANVLKSFGITKGDRVAIYLPLIPELAIAMLACARIGAVHSVIFGGFSAESLRDRINDQKARLLITADGGYRRGQVVALKRVADEALRDTPSVEHVIIVQRRHSPFIEECIEGRDHWYHDLDAACLARVRAGDDRSRRHAVHPLHVRHDREAEGHRAHDRRVPRGHLRDHQVGVRPQGRGRVLVHGRHRLGHRPQLCRVRPAGGGRHRRDVRGRPGLPAQGSVLGDHRALRGDDLLHGADSHPGVHEMGSRVAAEARHLDPAPARLSR